MPRRSGLPRNHTVSVKQRLVRLSIAGQRESNGSTGKDASFTYLTLGRRNPVAQGPPKDAAYFHWVVTGVPRHNWMNLNRADAHYAHIGPWV